MIPHDQAATIALALLEAGVEGADIIAAYVDQQSQPKPWELLSDREWSNIAAKRADDAANLVSAMLDRVQALERRV